MPVLGQPTGNSVRSAVFEETIAADMSTQEPISLSFELDIDDSSTNVIVAYFPVDKNH